MPEEKNFLRMLKEKPPQVQESMISHYEKNRRKAEQIKRETLEVVCKTPSIDIIELNDNCFFVLEEKHNEQG